MYNTDAMGVRIGELRRGKGLTQEAFAKKLGLSPQAVSKWETVLGYPDITLLPAIAETLGVPIETLFGAEAPQEPAVPDASAAPVPQDSPAEPNRPDFPETAGADRLAHQWGGTACYASAPPVRVSGSRVEFPDGSHADLANGEIVNQGRMRIRLAYDEDGGSG
ncbi:MAG: helix-turn-helix transcriptional regulator, partial [Eubacteriales bacterium]|nr:helix-turn-helix transcriptional regulator [Eubacteriales bacterium]